MLLLVVLVSCIVFVITTRFDCPGVNKFGISKYLINISAVQVTQSNETGLQFNLQVSYETSSAYANPYNTQSIRNNVALLLEINHFDQPISVLRVFETEPKLSLFLPITLPVTETFIDVSLNVTSQLCEAFEHAQYFCFCSLHVLHNYKYINAAAISERLAMDVNAYSGNLSLSKLM